MQRYGLKNILFWIIFAFGNLFAGIHSSCFAQSNENYIVSIRLLDPRVVTFTENTMETGEGSDATDIIASRTLTRSESKKLLELAAKELTDSDEFPFCGHSPGYAIIESDKSGKIVSAKTLCGMCHTWAGQKGVRAIQGKETLKYLEKLLPLPECFATKEKLRAIMNNDENRNKPFHELDSAE